jgi:hypothetical protein
MLSPDPFLNQKRGQPGRVRTMSSPLSCPLATILFGSTLQWDRPLVAAGVRRQ